MMRLMSSLFTTVNVTVSLRQEANLIFETAEAHDSQLLGRSRLVNHLARKHNELESLLLECEELHGEGYSAA